MSDPLFIDTGYVIALVNEHDLYHSQALQWAERYEGHPLVTTDAVLLEVGNALSRNWREHACQIIHSFENADEVTIIHLNPVLFKTALRLYEIHKDKTWGLVDCVSISVMREMELSVALAFDRHFIQAGFRLAD